MNKKSVILIAIITIISVIIGYYIYQNRTITLTVNINGNNLTNDTKLSCNTKYKDHKCNITLPTLYNKENQFLAYKSINNELYDSNQNFELKDNINLEVIEEETIELKLNINGNNILNNNELSCISSKRKHTCIIKLPELKENKDQFLAYNTNSNSKDPLYEQNQELELTNNLDLFIIEEEPLILNAAINGNNISNNNNISCKSRKKDSKCKIVLPKIITNTNTLKGYNNQNNNQILYKENQELELTNNINLYVIEDKTRLVHKLNINPNGANTNIKELSCVTNPNINYCDIQLPNVDINNRTILGYNDINTNTEKYKINDKIQITNNTTLYLISKETYTLKLDNYNVTCDIFNEEKECLVTLPEKGYENKEFIIDNQTYFNGEKITLTKNIEGRIQQLSYVVNPNTEIKFDNGCAHLETRKSNMETVKRIAPYLVHYTNSISFLSESSFSNRYPTKLGLVGVTETNDVYIKCTSNNTEYKRYGTLIHELTHSEIKGIVKQTGKSVETISKDIGVYNIFNTYKNATNKSERPLKDYSYSSIKEFMSDGYAYYFLGFKDPKEPYSTTDLIPNDLKKGFQRFDCILRDYINNYSNYNACLTKY